MSNVTPFPLGLGKPVSGQGTGQGAGQGSGPSQVGFERLELQRIMDLYGRMVAAGHWRDYAMDMGRDVAIFAAF
ncbi:MAG: DUF2794 domain-containing protein, partial [bacterium]|nr:DUF2794 domain-containing protein [bacterium]